MKQGVKLLYEYSLADLSNAIDKFLNCINCTKFEIDVKHPYFKEGQYSATIVYVKEEII